MNAIAEGPDMNPLDSNDDSPSISIARHALSQSRTGGIIFPHETHHRDFGLKKLWCAMEADGFSGYLSCSALTKGLSPFQQCWQKDRRNNFSHGQRAARVSSRQWDEPDAGRQLCSTFPSLNLGTPLPTKTLSILFQNYFRGHRFRRWTFWLGFVIHFIQLWMAYGFWRRSFWWHLEFLDGAGSTLGEMYLKFRITYFGNRYSLTWSVYLTNSFLFSLKQVLPSRRGMLWVRQKETWRMSSGSSFWNSQLWTSLWAVSWSIQKGNHKKTVY